MSRKNVLNCETERPKNFKPNFTTKVLPFLLRFFLDQPLSTEKFSQSIEKRINKINVLVDS